MNDSDAVMEAFGTDPEEVAMVTHRLLVAAYLRPDGSHGYLVSVKGDVPMTSYLGLTVIAQQNILEWGSE